MAPTIRPYEPPDRAAATLVFYRAVRDGTAAFCCEAERARWARTSEPDWSEPDKLMDQWYFVAE